jgi:hypothetical protein
MERGGGKRMSLGEIFRDNVGGEDFFGRSSELCG